MRFRIETSSKPPFWFVGNPALNERTEGSSALGCGLQITRAQQSISGAGYDTKLFFDRGNQGVVFSPRSRYEFPDEWARMDFIAKLAPSDANNRLHEWEGDVWMRIERGTDYREWLLPKATIALTGTELEGEVGLVLNYSISAGGVGAAQSGTSAAVNLIGYIGGAAVLAISGAELNAQYAVYNEGQGGELRCYIAYGDLSGSGEIVREIAGTIYAPPYFPDALTLPFDLEEIAEDIQASFSGSAGTEGVLAWVTDGTLYISTGNTHRDPANVIVFSVMPITGESHGWDPVTQTQWTALGGLGEPVNLVGNDGTGVKQLTGTME